MRRSENSLFLLYMLILVMFSAFAWIETGKAWSAENEPVQDESRKTKVKTWVEPVTNMEFTWVPEGCFFMGSPPDKEGHNPNEGPVHEVCVDGFWMGKHEVTREQFRRFVESGGYKTDAQKEGFSWVYRGEWGEGQGYDWQKTAFDQGERHPVVNVSWNDAKAMADWLSDQSKGAFRLPTEAEWEYACRAGTQTVRYWGDNPDEACAYANGADLTARGKFSAWTVHQCEDKHIYTAPVGSFKPNGFGLHDLLGNVWEWCEDTYGMDAYRQHRKENPVRKGKEPARVIRGGSWYSRPALMRCAGRDNLQQPNRRGEDVGFRLVRIP